MKNKLLILFFILSLGCSAPTDKPAPSFGVAVANLILSLRESNKALQIKCDSLQLVIDSIKKETK